MGDEQTKGVSGFDSKRVEDGFVAIITARGGSKGLPRKNVIPLSGKPLIAYSILAAKQCPYIQRCFVSTEDEEIKRVSLEWGAEVIDRPAELATDHALSKDVVRHVLKTLSVKEKLPNYFVLMQPTSPLRTAQHLSEAIQLFMNSAQAHSLVSVAEMDKHPYKTFEIIDGRLKSLFSEEFLDQPRQKLPKMYVHNGAIYMTGTSDFLQNDSFFTVPVVPYVMSSRDSVDIDSKLDLILVQQILNNEDTFEVT
jgi:CMP-N-acetylneuraminic acid synthetase